MKLATKFALAFVASAVLSVIVYSWVAATREVAQLESTVTEDLASLGRTLSTSVMDVWLRDGEARALEVVSIHDRDEAIDVRWTWLDVESNDPHFPRGGASVVPALRLGEQRTWVDVGPDGGRRVYSYVPLLREGKRPAALEFSRPLVRESDVFWQEIRDDLVASTLVATFATFLALFLTSWIVSRPLGKVADQARRIGAGDLSQRLAVAGNDEVSHLVHELNAMCDQLRDARTRADDETTKRLAALEQLRHADRLRTVGTLASGIAHELGTPLNVIAMRAKMVATGEIPPEDVGDTARIIVNQTERVTKIVRQLLDFARRRAPNRAETDLVELAERTAQLLSGLARKANVDLAVEKDDNTSGKPDNRSSAGTTSRSRVMAKVDTAQLEQAVTNLVINAVHATPKGGRVRVSVTDELAKKPGFDGESLRCACIRVVDTGSGISPDNLARIFEPFFTTKAVGEGTGLGLSVTHGIVEDHGGWMVAESELGKGSSFTLYFPAEPSP